MLVKMHSLSQVVRLQRQFHSTMRRGFVKALHRGFDGLARLELPVPATSQLPQPPHAERLRTIVSLNRIATLSKVFRKSLGYLFGSLMPNAIDGIERAIFLINDSGESMDGKTIYCQNDSYGIYRFDPTFSQTFPSACD